MPAEGVSGSGQAAPDVEIRPARRADLTQIARLLADDALGAAREQPAQQETYESAFAAIEVDPRNLLVVAEPAGRIVATLQLTFIPYLTHQGRERAQIEAVRIARPLRGEGLGQRLLDWAIAEARARGCHLVQLTTDKRRPDALRFYEGLGFRSSHEGLKLFL
jgi:ribosomal protein S18 acetylase RimI-like enzyme